MTLQDIARAIKKCSGVFCQECRARGTAEAWNCCRPDGGPDYLELRVMVPITKAMIDLGRKWTGIIIMQTLIEAINNANEEVRKTLCLPSEERVGVKMRPVVRGHWISETEADMLGDILLTGACSVCRQCNWDNVESYGFNFCPNCGTKMKKGKRYDRS